MGKTRFILQGVERPLPGAALGERIGILLHQAEEAAADVVARAEADASRTVAAAEARVAEAEELMESATTRAEDQARRIETVAKGEAAEIVAEAEARAAARTRQIEQWAEQVISHTRAEEARMFVEQQKAKEVAATELRSLAEQRRTAAATLLSVREAIGRAVGLIDDKDDKEESSTEPKASPSDEQEPEPAVAEARPSGHAAADMPDAEQLEAKLDAWVAGAPENS